MRVNFLFGPARTGKSTFLELMRTRGNAVHCLSELSYRWAQTAGRIDIAQAKSDKENPNLSDYQRKAARYTVINYIENHLIHRVFGSRARFVEEMFRRESGNYSNKLVWISVYDQIEFEIYKTLVEDYAVYEMSRFGSDYGADGREPPPEREFVIHLSAHSGRFYHVDGREYVD